MKTTTWLLLLSFWLSIGTTFAQNRNVSGQVTDSEGAPLIRATVLVKGTTTGAFTDEEGRYSLPVSGPDAVLVFRYIGYEGQEVIVGEQSTVNVTLGSANATVDEVVVLGYSAQKRSKITGSVSTINADEISETPVLRVEQALQGRAAGIQVTQNSGQPGAPLTVRIRGVGTTGNSDPLYVVDGVIVGGLDFLNPADIESISVLKDAASTAIYGTQGANGVVLITTKTGKRDQKAQVSYDGYYGIQEPWKVLNQLNAEEYAIMINEARIAAGLPLLSELADPASLGEGTDWQNEIFTRAPITSQQVAVRGGSSRSDYAVSANYFSQQGIVGGPKAQFDRITIRLNSNYDLNDRVRVGTRVNYISIERDALPENNEFSTPLIRALNLDPTTQVRDDNGNFLPSQFLDTDIFNPVNQIENSYSTYFTDRIFGTVFTELDLLKGLTFKTSLNLDVNNSRLDGFSPQYEISTNDRNLVNGVSVQHFRFFTYQWDNSLKYEANFGKRHEFSALVGSSTINNSFRNTGASRTDLRINDITYAYLDNGDPNPEASGAFGSFSESSLLSFFGRAYYAYANKYLVTAILRYDGSSRFGPNNKFGGFPSLSLGWVISEEDFMRTLPSVNFLKLRLSGGVNGNQSIADFQYLDLITNTQQGNGTNGTYSYTLGSGEQIVSGNSSPRRGNRDVRWEGTIAYNVGLDAGFWNDRLYVTADAYLRLTEGMLVTPEALGHVGALNSVVNAGSMRNQGLELALTYQDNLRQKINYSIGANVAFVENELTSLGDGGTPILSGFLQQANGFISRTEVGFPIAYMYGFETDGIFQTNEEVANHAFQADGTQAGDLRFVDQNEDGIIDDDDKVQIGNALPTITYGLTGSIDAFGFDFSFFLQGVYGNDIYRGFTRYDFDFANQPNSRLDRWTGEGTSNTEPRAVWGDPNQHARISDYFVEDGSFLRIKNVQLGYTLPQSILTKMRMNNLRVYLAGSNLFAFTNYSGLDPEIGNRGSLEIGIDRGFYPAPRVWQVGLQVGL
ncbi:MAG: TonB-dependent receptor [Bacteroidota bacterium]